jgi:hypothetical protein
VAEAPRRSTKDDPRRHYYRMTTFGRRVFSAEVVRLEAVVREAKLRLSGARPKEAS